MRRALVLAVVAGCQQGGSGKPADDSSLVSAAKSAERAAIGDLTGSGRGEVAIADAQRLRVLDAHGQELASVDAPAGIQVLEIARGMVLAGWGDSREHRHAPMRISAYRLQGGKLVETVIAEPQSERQEVAAIVPAPDGALLIAYYESKYVVHSALAKPSATGGWQLGDVAAIRMAIDYAYADLAGDHHPQLVVARVYGDSIDADGDAFVLGADGARTPIPTVRGSRGIAVGDSDGDGRDEVFLADGWSKNYAQNAHAHITWARADSSGAIHTDTLATLPDISAGRLVAADLDGDGKVELVSAGMKTVHLLRRQGDTWSFEKIGDNARDIAVGMLDHQPSILLVGEGAALIHPR